MQITKNFSLAELCVTNYKVDNTPTSAVKANIIEAAGKMLQPIRDYYGKPIKVNSGYRSPAVNKLAGGASSSSHMSGFAFDIKPQGGDMRELQRKVFEWSKNNKFDQIIIEQPVNGVATWIHVGYKRHDGSQRKQLMAAKKINGKWNYYAIDYNSQYVKV